MSINMVKIIPRFFKSPNLNISNIARECQVERKVVESYAGILENLIKKVAKKAGIYIIDMKKSY